jgi:hypothetical protein
MDENRIRFSRECAEQWRAFARAARNSESQEVRLQVATVWEDLATELEHPLAPEVADPIERVLEPNAAA